VSTGEDIFARIRTGLGRGPLSAETVVQLESRVAAHAPNLIPARSRVPEAERLRLFEQMAQEVGTTFAHAASYDDVPAALLAYLREHGLPEHLRMSPDAALDRIPWNVEPALEIALGRAEPADLVGVINSWRISRVARAFAAIMQGVLRIFGRVRSLNERAV
jgi:L-lactate dehydrogenase complex protein LldG